MCIYIYIYIYIHTYITYIYIYTHTKAWVQHIQRVRHIQAHAFVVKATHNTIRVNLSKPWSCSAVLLLLALSWVVLLCVYIYTHIVAWGRMIRHATLCCMLWWDSVWHEDMTQCLITRRIIHDRDTLYIHIMASCSNMLCAPYLHFSNIQSSTFHCESLESRHYVWYNILQYTILYYTILDYTIRYDTILYHIILYYTIL